MNCLWAILEKHLLQLSVLTFDSRNQDIVLRKQNQRLGFHELYALFGIAIPYNKYLNTNRPIEKKLLTCNGNQIEDPVYMSCPSLEIQSFLLFLCFINWLVSNFCNLSQSVIKPSGIITFSKHASRKQLNKGTLQIACLHF